MARLLKQKGSGHIFVWTPQLAERSDMEPYEPPAPAAPDPETPAQNPVVSSKELPPLDEALAVFQQEVRRPLKRNKA